MRLRLRLSNSISIDSKNHRKFRLAKLINICIQIFSCIWAFKPWKSVWNWAVLSVKWISFVSPFSMLGVVYSMNMHFFYKFRIHLENKWSKISILFFHLSITLTWIRHFRNVVKENKEEKRELYNGSEKCVEMYICFNVAAHFLTRTTIHFNSTFWWIFAENSCTSTAHLNSQHDKIVT